MQVHPRAPQGDVTLLHAAMHRQGGWTPDRRFHLRAGWAPDANALWVRVTRDGAVAPPRRA